MSVAIRDAAGRVAIADAMLRRTIAQAIVRDEASITYQRASHLWASEEIEMWVGRLIDADEEARAIIGWCVDDHPAVAARLLDAYRCAYRDRRARYQSRAHFSSRPLDILGRVGI